MNLKRVNEIFPSLKIEMKDGLMFLRARSLLLRAGSSFNRYYTKLSVFIASGKDNLITEG